MSTSVDAIRANSPLDASLQTLGAKLAGRRGLLFAIFTVSGFSGLIYESIWSHYLKLFLGHAAYAQTLVLAIFMGGMALGSWLVARHTHRIRNLLLGYALVEAVTGAIALGFHSLHVAALDFALDIAIPALGSAAAVQLFKWTLAALMILPQSILLGTTFPLISGAVIRRFPDRSGSTLAMLYFTNSLGAALGVLASGFWLIALVGLPGTVMTAGVLNILLAAVVWLLGKSAPEPAMTTAPSASAAGAASASATGNWVLWAAAGAGVAAFIYEIAWIRMLTLVLGASTHAFELMLSAFILGLALGGWWIRHRVERIADAPQTLAIMFAVMAVCAALTIPAYGAAFDWLAYAMRMFDTSEAGYTGFNWASHVAAAAMMIPTTFVAGMTLPLMTHWLLTRGTGERAIGRVYACNTLGSIAGVLLAVHVLMPIAGAKGTLLVGALAQLAIALLFLRRSVSGWSLSAATLTVLAAGAAIAGVSLLAQLDPMRMAVGVYRTGVARLPENIQVLRVQYGKTATITLTQDGRQITIATNGKPDASINMVGGPATPDEVTQTLAAVLPLTLHPAPKRVANIGFGSGITSQVLLDSPLVKKLDSIEIEPAMTESARLAYGERIGAVFTDPRSAIHFDDAKSFFASAREPYDIIVSEPSNPWISGVATLFSEEFYARIQRYLTDDGLLVQWLQIYETDTSVIASVLGALSSQFTDYAIYNTGDSDILVVASRKKLPRPNSAAAFAQPALANELRRIGIQEPAQIELRRIGNKRELDPLLASYRVPRNSDYFPYVDLNAPRLRYMRQNALELSRLDVGLVPLARLTFGTQLPQPTSGAANSGYGREQRAIQAGRIANALENGTVAGLENSDWSDIALVRTAADGCSDAALAGAWRSALYRLSIQLNAYLPEATLARFWSQWRASACYRESGLSEQRWLDFLALLASGRAAAVADAGLALWLTKNNGLDGDQTADLMIATAAGLIGSGRHAEAQKFLASALSAVRDLGRYALAARWLAALATTSAANDDSRS